MLVFFPCFRSPRAWLASRHRCTIQRSQIPVLRRRTRWIPRIRPKAGLQNQVSIQTFHSREALSRIRNHHHYPPIQQGRRIPIQRVEPTRRSGPARSADHTGRTTVDEHFTVVYRCQLIHQIPEDCQLWGAELREEMDEDSSEGDYGERDALLQLQWVRYAGREEGTAGTSLRFSFNTFCRTSWSPHPRSLSCKFLIHSFLNAHNLFQVTFKTKKKLYSICSHVHKFVLTK